MPHSKFNSFSISHFMLSNLPNLYGFIITNKGLVLKREKEKVFFILIKGELCRKLMVNTIVKH